MAPISLVHGLQNHDELTHELVHFAAGHAEDEFLFKGKLVKGADLAVRIRSDLINHLTGEAAPYNRTFTTNGIACTTASVISAALGYRSLGRDRAGGDRGDQDRPPPAQHVQRPAARRLRPVRLGPGGDADARADTRSPT